MNGDHDEVMVGGPLDEPRLRAVMARGYALRNLSVPEDKALEYEAKKPGSTSWSECGFENHTDGETPTLVYGYEPEMGYDPVSGEMVVIKRDSLRTIELHVGCGDHCGVLAAIRYDSDLGGCDEQLAQAIAHAGRDLIDLVRELVKLRATVAELRGGRLP